MSASTKPESQQPEAGQQQMQAENVNAKLIARLRVWADFLERNPTLPPAYEESRLLFFVHDALEFRLAARDLPRPVEKKASDHSYYLSHNFPDGSSACIIIQREKVCTAIEVEEIEPATPEIICPAKVIPAQPARIVKKTVWRCPDSLLRPEPEEDTEATF